MPVFEEGSAVTLETVPERKESRLLDQYYQDVAHKADKLLATCFPDVIFPKNEVIRPVTRLGITHASLDKEKDCYVIEIGEFQDEKDALIENLMSTHPSPFSLTVTYGDGTKVLREVEDTIAFCHEKLHELFCERVAKNNPDYPIQKGAMLMYLLYEGFSVTGEFIVLDLMSRQTTNSKILESIQIRKEARRTFLENNSKLPSGQMTYATLYAIGEKLVKRMFDEIGMVGFTDFLTNIDAWKAYDTIYPSKEFDKVEKGSATDIINDFALAHV